MSFWNLSNNSEVQATTDYDIGGGDPIPTNTNCKACIDQIGWAEWEGEEYINARWVVIDGEFKNRKVFQKIKVNDYDANKRDKAIRMLAAIDANCGGKLRQSAAMPDDNALMTALSNRPMVIKVMKWEMDDGRSGNWVSKVSAFNSQNAGPEIDLNEELDF